MINDYENWAGFDDYFRMKNSFERENRKKLQRKFEKKHHIKNLEMSRKYYRFVEEEFDKHMAKKKMQRAIDEGWAIPIGRSKVKARKVS